MNQGAVVLVDRTGLPVDTERRLDDWGSWARKRLNLDPHGHCASAEGMFNSGGGGGGAEMVDLLEVLAVERVVTSRLAVTYREIVRRHFVLKQSPKVIVRAVRIQENKFSVELRWAVLMVKNNLTQSERRA